MACSRLILTVCLVAAAPAMAVVRGGDAALRYQDAWYAENGLQDPAKAAAGYRAVADATEALDRFRLNEAASGLYHFVWDELADWYLELVKPRLREDADPASREAAPAVRVASTATRRAGRTRSDGARRPARAGRGPSAPPSRCRRPLPP